MTVVEARIDDEDAPDAGAAEGGTSWRRSLRWIIPWALFGIVFVLHWRSPNVTVADSYQSIPTAMSIYKDGDVHLENNLPGWDTTDFALRHVNGHTVPYFPWGAPLFAVPFLAWADIWSFLTGGITAQQYIEKPGATWPFEVISMAAVVALTTVVLYHVARLVLVQLPERRRLWASSAVALTFAFGTAAWSTADRALWQHGPSMLWLSCALLAAVIIETGASRHAWRAPTALGAAAAAAYATRPTNSLAIMGLGIWLLVRHPRTVGWAVAGGAPVGILFLGVNRWQYGAWMPEYYEPTFGRAPHFWEALAANLVSPARGIFVFSPILLLALIGPVLAWRRGQFASLHVTLVLIILAHLATISDFANWWAGYSYGPRFMSDMAPFLIFLLLPVAQWLWRPGRIPLRAGAAIPACVALLGASVVVNAEGALLYGSHCWNSPTAGERIWDWRDGQFLYGFSSLRDIPLSHQMTRNGFAVYGCPARD